MVENGKWEIEREQGMVENGKNALTRFTQNICSRTTALENIGKYSKIYANRYRFTKKIEPESVQ